MHLEVVVAGLDPWASTYSQAGSGAANTAAQGRA